MIEIVIREIKIVKIIGMSFHMIGLNIELNLH